MVRMHISRPFSLYDENREFVSRLRAFFLSLAPAPPQNFFEHIPANNILSYKKTGHPSIKDCVCHLVYLVTHEGLASEDKQCVSCLTWPSTGTGYYAIILKDFLLTLHGFFYYWPKKQKKSSNNQNTNKYERINTDILPVEMVPASWAGHSTQYKYRL